tara:strand:+ start:537 stop:746 length:210 start_codon:yes stop_codon:yes gene_type:complete
MEVKTKPECGNKNEHCKDLQKQIDYVFTKDYVEFLSEAGWILERKTQFNLTHYSDLLEDKECDNKEKIV